MPDLASETILNERYRIVRKLGQGGMGAVYLAYDLSLEHQVAVKANHNPSPQGTTQFLREARLLASLRHPNLPRVLDYFIIAEDQYLVMDYIAGDDLATRLKTAGAQPLELVLHWADELASALAYLHRQNPPVIHRDIKPANIKLTLEGDPVLVDFGIAKAVDLNQETATGAVGYTPGYAPPEQYSGSSRTGPYSDQYALAATLYALITGQRPEDGVQRVLGRATLIPTQTLNPTVPEPVDQAIQKAMSIRPEDRFASVGEFLQALLSFQSEQTIARTPANITDNVGAGSLTIPSGLSSGLDTTVASQTRASGTRSMPVYQGVTPAIAAPPITTKREVPWLWVGFGIAGLALVAIAIIFIVLVRSANPNRSSLLVQQPTSTMTSKAIAMLASATPLPPSPTATETPLPSPTSTPLPTSTSLPAATITPTLLPQATATASQLLMGGGKLIAFSSDRADGKTLQIWIMQLSINPLSTIVPVNVTQITSGPGDKTQPGWSPDGKQIIYVAPGDPKNGKDIWIMNTDGSSAHDLTNYPGDESDPSWSPDGKWIAFTNQRSSDSLQQVYVIGVDGSQLTRISTDQVEYQPFWTKDMKWLMNVIQVSGNNYLRMRDQANEYKGTPVPFDIFTVFGRLGQVANAVFSPDGSQIAYTKVDTPTSFAICVVDYASRGANITQISTVNKDKEPTWSPDAKWLVFTSTRDGKPELYIMTTAGKLQTSLTSQPGRSMQASWQP